MNDISVRSPTRENYLRVQTKGYLTDKAAAFEAAYKEGKYQAAVYIKDSADSVYVFACDAGILTEEDIHWYSGTEETEPLFRAAIECKCRDKVDGELREKEVIRRFDNLVAILQKAFNRSLTPAAAERALQVLSETAAKVRKAADCG